MASVPLSDAEIKSTTGPVVYLIHFDRPLHHALHYLGWTTSLIDRIARHRGGTGARLLEVIGQYGIGFTVVRIWQGDRHLERRLKRWHSGVRLCPLCQAKRRAQRHQGRLF